MTRTNEPAIQFFLEGFNWQDVPRLAYKDEGSHFRDISRQLLFAGDPELPCQLRYFEIDAGGHSTLECHRHLHVVVILRGSGRCLVADQVHAVSPFDLIRIPPLGWHQFRADNHEPLGFLCLVSSARDKPQLPTPDDLEKLRGMAAIADFIRV